MTRKVLIITYYWPPSGGGGVQRWLKFVKYLPKYGWEPIVFTPKNPEFDLCDESLAKDVNQSLQVVRFPIWEPFGFYRSLLGKKSGQQLKQGIVIEKSKLSPADKLAIWIRANLFIPDPRRFWVNPSVKFLKDFIRQNNIQTIITTGPPHSMHLIGLKLKRQLDVKWIADFRDPWSDWDILDKMKSSRIARSIHRKMEKKVMQHADLVLTVSNRLADQFRKKGFAKKVSVITNGVDEDDFQESGKRAQSDKFRITHMGLLNEIRNPECLWLALEGCCEENRAFAQDLELVLAGMVSGSILDRLQASKHLSSTTRHLDYISHKSVFEYYQNSAVLLLLLNQTENAQWILPGKVFEYLLANKPILTLGAKESDLADVLEETQAGRVIEFEDQQAIKHWILSAYDDFKSGITGSQIKNTEKYLRKNLAGDLAVILDQI